MQKNMQSSHRNWLDKLIHFGAVLVTWRNNNWRCVFGVMLVLAALSIALSIKIQEYSLLKQIFHFKGKFPELENYGFVLKNTVYTRTTPRGDNTYTVYINFDKQIYCEKNGKEVPEFNFVISDIIRDGLVTVEREVI